MGAAFISCSCVGDPCHAHSPVKIRHYPILRGRKVELRQVKNMLKHISTAEGKEGFYKSRICAPFPSQPNRLPPNAFGPRSELLTSARPPNPSSMSLDSLLS